MRPIELFCSLGKYLYSVRTQTTQILRIFTKVWSEISQFAPQNDAKALAGTMRRSLRLIGYQGVKANFD